MSTRPAPCSHMRADISEFSFGYAVTEALAQRWRPNLTAAPVFPSLLEEGKVGYDVKLQRRGVPIFLQFKVSERMVRATAREVREGLLNVPSVLSASSRCLASHSFRSPTSRERSSAPSA